MNYFYYTKDMMSTSPKVINEEFQKYRYLKQVANLFETRFCLSSLFQPTTLSNEKLMEIMDEKNRKKYLDEIRNKLFNSADKGKSFNSGLLDINGNFYMTNNLEMYPTNITLNYKNKDKPTAPLAPNLRDEIIMI